MGSWQVVIRGEGPLLDADVQADEKLESAHEVGKKAVAAFEDAGHKVTSAQLHADVTIGLKE